MSKKSAKIAALIDGCRGHELLDARYLGYFECFNRGLFYESHDVLEELWLANREGPSGAFYKGLIQFAGAFVHLQKHTEQRPRLRPAAALFKLAQSNLRLYPTMHERLDVAGLLALIEDWITRIDTAQSGANPFTADHAPKLKLKGGS